MNSQQSIDEAAAGLGCIDEVSIAGKVAALEILVGLLRDQASGVPLAVAKLRAWSALIEKRGQLERQLGELMASAAAVAWSNELRRRGSDN